jgi:hypothetical protein
MSDELTITNMDVRCLACDHTLFAPLVSLKYDENGKLVEGHVGHMCAGCGGNVDHETLKLHTNLRLRQRHLDENDAALAALKVKQEQLRQEGEASVARFAATRVAFEKAHPAPGAAPAPEPEEARPPGP